MYSFVNKVSELVRNKCELNLFIFLESYSFVSADVGSVIAIAV